MIVVHRIMNNFLLLSAFLYFQRYYDKQILLCHSDINYPAIKIKQNIVFITLYTILNSQKFEKSCHFLLCLWYTNIMKPHPRNWPLWLQVAPAVLPYLLLHFLVLRPWIFLSGYHSLLLLLFKAAILPPHPKRWSWDSPTVSLEFLSDHYYAYISAHIGHNFLLYPSTANLFRTA